MDFGLGIQVVSYIVSLVFGLFMLSIGFFESIQTDGTPEDTPIMFQGDLLAQLLATSGLCIMLGAFITTITGPQPQYWVAEAVTIIVLAVVVLRAPKFVVAFWPRLWWILAGAWTTGMTMYNVWLNLFA